MSRRLPIFRWRLRCRPPSAGDACFQCLPQVREVRDFSTYVPTAKATRIEASEAPIIDGDVSDAVWAKAQVIDEFYQLEPDTGQPVSERTELRILYDTDNLYISVYAYDRNPELITRHNEEPRRQFRR